MSLSYIASYDDLIQFCGTNLRLAERHFQVFKEKESREDTFDPYLTCASNVSFLEKKHDLWTNKSKKRASKRKYNRFDVDKWTKLFITNRKAFLEDSEKPEVVRTGFDPYAYLMAYEDDVMNLYSDLEITKLQKACLHFIEIGKEIVPLDYIKYIASYDDLVISTVSSKPADQSWEQWIPAVGKMHYDGCGFTEIMSGTRPLNDFFDAIMYTATYPFAKDFFSNEDSEIDEDKAAIAYITFGAVSGLVRKAFSPNIFLANYPEYVKEDIYTDGALCNRKIAKLWLDKVGVDAKLDTFDVDNYKIAKDLADDVDIFEARVKELVEEHKLDLKKKNSLTAKFIGLTKCPCCVKAPHLPTLPTLPTLPNLPFKLPSMKYKKVAKKEVEDDDSSDEE